METGSNQLVFTSIINQDQNLLTIGNIEAGHYDLLIPENTKLQSDYRTKG